MADADRTGKTRPNVGRLAGGPSEAPFPIGASTSTSFPACQPGLSVAIGQADLEELHRLMEAHVFVPGIRATRVG